ncbi:heme/copper-type cytochrome/quinol oxidase subunit 2 [Mucilaginibacter sp. UYP25]
MYPATDSKIQYLYLTIGLIISSATYCLIAFLNIFIWWFLFGEGESSDEKYHPVSAQLFAISPLVIIYIIYCLLIYKSLQVNNLSRVKSLFILTVLMITFHFMRNVLLSTIINS